MNNRMNPTYNRTFMAGLVPAIHAVPLAELLQRADVIGSS